MKHVLLTTTAALALWSAAAGAAPLTAQQLITGFDAIVLGNATTTSEIVGPVLVGGNLGGGSAISSIPRTSRSRCRAMPRSTSTEITAASRSKVHTRPSISAAAISAHSSPRRRPPATCSRRPSRRSRRRSTPTPPSWPRCRRPAATTRRRVSSAARPMPCSMSPPQRSQSRSRG